MRFFSILFTVFIDYLGIGLVFPFLFPMIMDPASGFLGLEASEEQRGWVVGLLLAVYSIAQFWSLPVLGGFSDRYGRKKILNLSLFVVAFGFLVGAIGVILQSVWLLFLSRIIAGVGSGNYAVAQAAVSDVARGEKKTKYFGLLNTACGCGFIIGPFLGGKLSNYSLFGFSSFATPFFASFILALINVWLVVYYFKETSTVFKKVKISFLKSIYNFQKAFSLINLRSLFTTMFLFSFGWGFLCEFLPLFLIKKLDFGPEEIGYTYAYIGGLVALFQGFAIRPFVKRFSPKNLLVAGLLLLGSVTPLLFLAHSTSLLLLILLPIMFFESLIYPSASTIVSDSSALDEQGENLGIHQSVQAAGIACAPIFSGSIVALNPTLPIWVGFLAPLLSCALLLLFKSSFWGSTAVEQQNDVN
jgi:DHA1 family tetracycline resistance protein-like MFS transporter